MHNGCLLLLAFVAVFQPIASYSERGLVDGRQQRCDYRTSVRDPGLNFHGTYRFSKPAVEDRRLNHRGDTREVRRNKVREENLRVASSSHRRLANTSERDRNTLASLSKDRIGNDAVLRRENRETRLVSSRRDERNQEIRRERLSTVQETHQARFDSRRENSRLSGHDNRSQRIDNRVSVESRRDVRGNGIIEAKQRVRNHQEVRVEMNRVRDNEASSLNDRRIAKETIERMDTRRSVSRVQRDRNEDRETVGRRSSRELRSLSISGKRTNRAYEDTTSLDRNDRRISSSQPFDNEQRQLDSRIRLTVERRNIRDAVSRRVLGDRTSENRRDVQRIQRVKSTGSRKDNRDTKNTRLARAVRSVSDLASQNDRSEFRIRSREVAAENRRNSKDAHNMVRTRSLEQSVEYRNDFRSSERVLENRGDNRNIEREPRQNIDTIRVAEARNSNRDTCVYDRDLSSELRMTRMARERSQENRRLPSNVESRAFRAERTGDGLRGVREVNTRAIRTERIDKTGRDARDNELRAFRNERADQSRRVARTVGVRSFRTERSDESQRDTQNIAVRVFRTERSDDSRRDAQDVAIRSFRTERSVESRPDDNRNINSRLFKDERTSESRRNAREIGIRAFRTERTDESRRDARNVEVRAFRTERTDEGRRDARNVEVRAFRAERTDESRRDARNVEVRAFRTERTDESHRDARNVEVRAFRTERTDESRRDARNVEVRAFRTERTDESRRDARNVEVRAFRAERTDESRRDARNVEVRAFRTERTEENRRDARNIEARATKSATHRYTTRSVERQSRSLDRVTDSRRDRENNSKDARIQERALESRRNVRSIESRSEAERANNPRAARSLEREIRSIGRERSMESRLNEKPTRDSRMFTVERGSDRRERNTENRRHVRNVHKGMRSLDVQERGVETRRMDFVRSGDVRETERLSKRDSIDSRRAYTLQRESRRDTQRSNDNNPVRRQEAKSRHSFDTGFVRNREFQNLFKKPTQTEYEKPIMNWQCVFYALQGLYICGLLMQLNNGSAEKKTRVSWWLAPQHLIKVD